MDQFKERGLELLNWAMQTLGGTAIILWAKCLIANIIKIYVK